MPRRQHIRRTWTTRAFALTTIVAVAATAVFAYNHRGYYRETRSLIMSEQAAVDDVPLNKSYTGQNATDLGPYYTMEEYADQPELSSDEVQELTLPWQIPVAYGTSDHPVAIAQNGLHNYCRYRATGDNRFFDRAKAAADLLANLQYENGSWTYSFDFRDLEAGWTSAMAQGQAMSLLLRVNQESPNPRYIEAADASYRYMMQPVGDGGTLDHYGDGAPILEEYPNSSYSPYTLNGSIFALWGLWDYALVRQDTSAAAAFDQLSAALADHLSLYDTGSWSLYSLSEEHNHLAPDIYHNLHIVQLRAMGELTGDKRWTVMAGRWNSYREAKANPVSIWWEAVRRRVGVLVQRSRPVYD